MPGETRTGASILYANIRVIYRNDTRLAGGCTNRVASYLEFSTHFGVLSRAYTQFNPTLWACDQLQFKFGVSALFGCEEKRMQS